MPDLGCWGLNKSLLLLCWDNSGLRAEVTAYIQAFLFGLSKIVHVCMWLNANKLLPKHTQSQLLNLLPAQAGGVCD